MSFWHELVQSITPDCTFEPPASEEALAEVEKALGVTVPKELMGLWRESNGIQDSYSNGVWSTKTVIHQNLELRSLVTLKELYMPFDPLFFFADAGNGDLFFFPIHAGVINCPDVFRWEHESDSRTWQCNNLQPFVEQWFRGELSGSG